jgi:hypothetical protein
MNDIIPSNIVGLIKEGWTVVLNDGTHVLPYSFRFRLWDLMGPRRNIGEQPSKPHTQRTRLAMACAAKVLKIWDQHWPHNSTAHNALQIAEQALADPIHPEPYLDSMQHCIMEVEQAMGQSAVEALYVAIHDESHLEDSENEGDLQTGGPFSDAAANAVVAYANGTIRHPDSNPQRRLEFWRWYLSEAIPSVYDADPLDLD